MVFLFQNMDTLDFVLCGTQADINVLYLNLPETPISSSPQSPVPVLKDHKFVPQTGYIPE